MILGKADAVVNREKEHERKRVQARVVAAWPEGW
jgi:hypothetical protein